MGGLSFNQNIINEQVKMQQMNMSKETSHEINGGFSRDSQRSFNRAQQIGNPDERPIMNNYGTIGQMTQTLGERIADDDEVQQEEVI